jgi:hypothetical protein
LNSHDNCVSFFDQKITFFVFSEIKYFFTALRSSKKTQFSSILPLLDENKTEFTSANPLSIKYTFLGFLAISLKMRLNPEVSWQTQAQLLNHGVISKITETKTSKLSSATASQRS